MSDIPNDSAPTSPAEGPSRLPPATLYGRMSEKTLRDVLFVLFRQKLNVALFATAVLLTVTAVTVLSPEIYRSETKLLIRLGRESITLDPTAATGQTVHIQQFRESEIKSEMEILRSRSLVEDLVDSVGAETILTAGLSSAATDPPQEPGAVTSADEILQPMRIRDKAVRKVLRSLAIGGEARSNIIDASFEAEDPLLAQAVLKRVIEIYMERHIQAYRSQGSHRFFQEQSQALQAELDRLEAQISHLKTTLGTASPDADDETFTRQLTEIRLLLARTLAERRASEERVRSLRTTLADLPERILTRDIETSPTLSRDGLEQRLSELRLQEQELLTRYTEGSRTIQTLRQQIQEAQRLLENAASRRESWQEPSPLREKILLELHQEEANFASLDAKAVALAQQEKGLLTELAAQNDNRSLLRQLLREQSISEAKYRDYVTKREQARIDELLEMQKISNISVVQEPSLPLRPVRPNKLLNMVLGLFLGVTGGVFLAFFLEFVDRTFRSPEDVQEKLECPLLCSLPLFPPDAGLQPELTCGGPHQGWLEPSPRLEQPIEAMRERLNQLADLAGRPLRSIGVVSSRPGEGVTTIAANLAVLLAETSERRCLLIDVNVPRPRLHEILDRPIQPGLSELLIDEGKGWKESVVKTQAENLDFLAAGLLPLNLGWLPRSAVLQKLLRTWHEQYSHIILDLPALEPENAVGRLAGLLDGVAFVVEAESIRYEPVRWARSLLPQHLVVGAVLNKRRHHIPSWIYRRL